jgi:epoxyqueuosine reductase
MSAGLAELVRDDARALGFELVGIAAPDASAHLPHYQRWLAQGRHGEMGYLARPDAVARRADLRGTLPEVRSVVVVGMGYLPDEREDEPDDPAAGVIARYARGRDYHELMKARLLQLLDRVAARAGAPVVGRAYVDTGPLLERELASWAGIGWFGKNTMLIHPRRGSWFFLGALLLDLPLAPDAPFAADHCGSCARCLEACPTGALLGRDPAGAPVMDARRCISYLTIELRGPIPRALRPAIGNRIYGCDICQEVCPFNGPKFAEATREPGFAAASRMERPALAELMAMDEDAWERFSRGSAVRRAKRAGFLRNVAVALGNWGAPEAEPPLVSALDDAEPLVRGHAAWALGRIGTEGARTALARRLEREQDGFVREEIQAALAG